MKTGEKSARKLLHEAYLKSDHWKALRQAAIDRDGGVCVRCGDAGPLHGHHKVYRTPLESGVLEDIETLCKTCHRMEHNLPVRFPSDVLHDKLWNRGIRGEGPPTFEEYLEQKRLTFDEESRRQVVAAFRMHFIFQGKSWVGFENPWEAANYCCEGKEYLAFERYMAADIADNTREKI